MDNYDMDEAIMEFSSGQGKSYWRMHHCFLSTLIIGNTGSGKSTGSAKTYIYRLLTKKFAGIVLTVKPDEKEMWEEYCRRTGREHDLIVLNPQTGYRFNFMHYLSGNKETALTENLVDILTTCIEAGNDRNVGKSNDTFWVSAMESVLSHTIDLLKLAYGFVKIEDLYNVIQTIPKSLTESSNRISEGDLKEFDNVFNLARNNVRVLVDNWVLSLPKDKRQSITQQDYIDNIPECRILKFVDSFFFDSYIDLADKTRSIVDYSCITFLYPLLRDPIYSMFCHKESNITPLDCYNGKIILIDMPVSIYGKVGRDIQIMLKIVFQKEFLKRPISANTRPLFIWADEAQHFLHRLDPMFLATSRSSRIANVFITQNIANMIVCMGGNNAVESVKALFGLFGNKIIHSNVERDTNVYSSELIGDEYVEDNSTTITVGNELSTARGRSYKLERIVRPEDFVRLKAGGKINHYKVEAYLHRQDEQFYNGYNHLKVTFDQNYRP